MNASNFASLQTLVARGRHSLLQYISDACPFTTGKTSSVRDRVLAAAAEERSAIARILRLLQKRHVRRVIDGSYPASFTQYNFITIDSLIPKLIAENEDQLLEIEKRLNETEDPETRGLLMAFLDMKRRHFQLFNDAAAK